MRKDKKNNSQPAEVTNSYELKTKAVDELVDILKNQDEDTNFEEEKSKNKNHPNPYKLDRLARIPTWIKAFFIKFWVAGAICYFFFWGLGYYVNTMDLIILTGLATGLITDLLVNSAFLYFQSDQKEYNRYMFLPVSCKKVWTLFVNIPLGIIEVLIVFYIYTFINKLFVDIKGLPEGTTSLGVGPLLYGLFFLLVDMFFISMKNLMVKIVKDAQKG